jgi:hypothetical protein
MRALGMISQKFDKNITTVIQKITQSYQSMNK